MTLFKIVKKSLSLYRMNLVLILPPLVPMIFQLIISIIMASPPVSPTSQVFAPAWLTLVFTALGVLFLNLVISFLVILGQVSMTGKVILEGKTRLSEWGRGVKRFFLRVLGLGLIYLGIVIAFFMLVMFISMLAILPQLISQLGNATPSEMPQISPLIFTALGSVTAALGSVTAFLMTIASAIFYIWLAPAVLDDKGVSASLKAGTEAMVKSGKMFLGFVALFFLIFLVPTLLTGTSSSYLGTMVQPAYSDYVTPTLVASQVMTTIFSPLWFLIAFAIFDEQRTVRQQVALDESVMSKPTKYCPNCGLEIDRKVMSCPRCGFEQPPMPGEVEKHTGAWYIVPLLLGIIGGIIGYIVIKDDDKKMATSLLIIGLIMTFAIPIVAGLAIGTWPMSILRGLTSYSLLVNEEAPLFTLTDIKGANFSLNDFKGKVVVLDFFATWCGPCKTQMPYLSQICEKHDISKVVVISISIDPYSDTNEKLKQFASDNNMTWIVARDTAGVAKNYKATVIPTLFIIDRNGIIRYAHVGVTPVSTLLSEIDSLLKQ